MLQSGQGPEGAGRVAANSLKALLKKSKKHAVCTALRAKSPAAISHCHLSRAACLIASSAIPTTPSNVPAHSS